MYVLRGVSLHTPYNLGNNAGGATTALLQSFYDCSAPLTNRWKPASPDYIDARKSLKPSNYEDYRDELLFTRHEDSCTWLLDNKLYKAWAEEEEEEKRKPILWISGGPGCGKSVLSAFLCKEIFPNEESQPAVAYFFCDDKDERLRTAKAILTALLHQLLGQLPGVAEHFKTELSEGGETCWTYSKLWRVFERVMIDTNTRRVRLLIDALGIQPISNRRVHSRRSRGVPGVVPEVFLKNWSGTLELPLEPLPEPSLQCQL
jgi:Cdc6-like AAA superfamily ATPase